MDVSSHTVSFPAGQVPEWIHLIPAGTFSGVDGKPYVLRDAEKVIAASMTAGKLPVDENHSTQRAPAAGAPSPARGWIVELQNRADGIWGRSEWNESGTALMTDKAYKGISPVFTYDKADGTVIAILSAALTNNPNLTQLTALHTNGNDMDKIAICTALGIAGTVDDAAVMTALQTAVAAGTELATVKAELAALKLTHVPIERVTALETSLNTLQAEGKRAAAVAFVDAAIKAGKPIAAARDAYIAQHVADPAGTETLVNLLPSINGAGGQRRVALHDASDDALTAEEVAICTVMGTDLEEYKAFKKKQAVTTEGSAA